VSCSLPAKGSKKGEKYKNDEIACVFALLSPFALFAFVSALTAKHDFEKVCPDIRFFLVFLGSKPSANLHSAK
jgi:hypothetical protein